MVESIEDLRKICQTGRSVRGREGEHWITAKYQRGASIYITKLFLYTSISANQVSLIQILVGISAGFFFGTGAYWYSIFGALLIYLSEILDSVDGEVARYRETAGKKGETLERMLHPILYPFIFGGLTFGIVRNSGDNSFYLFGFSMVSFLLVHEILKEVINEYQTKKFHASHRETLRISLKSPQTFITFISTSKHLRNAVILTGAFLNQLPLVLIGYGILLPLSYILKVWNAHLQLE